MANGITVASINKKWDVIYESCDRILERCQETVGKANEFLRKKGYYEK